MKALALAFFVLGTASQAFAASTQAELGSFLNYQDKIEIQASAMAETKSQNLAILGYASRVKTNHVNANLVLATLAEAEQLSLSASGPRDAELANLASLTARNFDGAYKALMVGIHEDALSAIDHAAPLTSTPVGAFSQVIRTRVADGLQQAKDLDLAPVAQGVFKSADAKHSTAGSFTVTKKASGLVLTLDKSFSTSTGPDLRVVLRDSTGRNPMVVVSELKSFSGAQQYMLNLSEADLSKFNEVVIYCAKFHVDFGIASFIAP